MRVTDPGTAAERAESSFEEAARSHRGRVTARLLAQITRTRDAEERRRLQDEVVLVNRCIATAISSSYRNRGISDEDLEQVAFLALVKAVRGFDPRFDSDFLSYAVPTIRGEVKRHFRDQGWMVRPPRRLQELQPRVKTAGTQLAQILQRSPTPREVADHLGVSLSEVVEALAAEGCFSPRSLDVPLHDDAGGNLAESLGRDDPALAAAEARIVLGPALRALGPRDKKIVELRFFAGLTQQEIGDQIGVTQMQVSRLLARILEELRSQVA